MAEQLATDHDDTLWTYAEVAAYLRISPRTVQRSLVDGGLLKSTSATEKRPRIRVADLRRYLDGGDARAREDAVVRALRPIKRRARSS